MNVDPGFEALYEREFASVFRAAFLLCGDRSAAEDATQEAFLTALRKLSSFRGEAAFTTWMHRVTVNACYDLLRKRQRAPLLDRGQDERDPGPEPPPAPDHADSSDLSIDVQRALLEVPEDFRTVMILHDVQDLPYEQVASIVGVPVGTVNSRLHRGRVALARAMGLTGSALRERPDAAGPSQGTMPR